MIYGMYLSAAGIVSSSYRQDTIANNLANSETTGFKRNVATFQERLTEAKAMRLGAGDSRASALLDRLSGGLLASPTDTDYTQGELEATGNTLDVAIQGKGFVGVRDAKGQLRLTRDGQMIVNQNHELVLANDHGQKILDQDQKPISFEDDSPGGISIDKDGTVLKYGKIVRKIGLFDADQQTLVKRGGNLVEATDPAQLRQGDATFVNQFVERANVDPAHELVDMMEAQRQLEANANMIRYQDQSVTKAVNDLGKVS